MGGDMCSMMEFCSNIRKMLLKLDRARRVERGCTSCQKLCEELMIMNPLRCWTSNF